MSRRPCHRPLAPPSPLHTPAALRQPSDAEVPRWLHADHVRQNVLHNMSKECR